MATTKTCVKLRQSQHRVVTKTTAGETQHEEYNTVTDDSGIPSADGSLYSLYKSKGYQGYTDAYTYCTTLFNHYVCSYQQPRAQNNDLSQVTISQSFQDMVKHSPIW